MEEFVTVRLLL